MIQAAEELSACHVAGTQLELLEVGCCALAEYGGSGPPRRDQDLVAGVLRSFQGRLAGTALLAMDPEDALWWARAGEPSPDPVATYVELAGRLLARVIESVATSLGLASELGRPRLEENSLAGCLLCTHAPSDTVVLYAVLRIDAAGRSREACLNLLMEPKRLASLAAEIRSGEE